MAYKATIIPVMIASPSDVEEERRIVREVLHDWNDVHSKSRMIAFMPVAWETHASPGLDGRPQDSINEHLLEECDLLVGVFWTRIGTPTGSEPSGTVEEIKEHHAAGRPAMLYFSSAQISPEEIDSDQYAKVKEFKTWSKENGLIEEYGNVEEFREKLTRQLQLTLQQNSYLHSVLDDPNSIIPDSDLVSISELSLSPDARELLLAASKSEDGTILACNIWYGYYVKAGAKEIRAPDGRESARWKGALDELMEGNCIEVRGAKGEMFVLTHAGWEAADRLRVAADATGKDRR